MASERRPHADEIEAMAAAWSALEPLTHEERRRAMQWLSSVVASEAHDALDKRAAERAGEE